jgi:tetratricopeptide (TPR) repeat protein
MPSLIEESRYVRGSLPEPHSGAGRGAQVVEDWLDRAAEAVEQVHASPAGAAATLIAWSGLRRLRTELLGDEGARMLEQLERLSSPELAEAARSVPLLEGWIERAAALTGAYEAEELLPPEVQAGQAREMLEELDDAELLSVACERLEAPLPPTTEERVERCVEHCVRHASDFLAAGTFIRATGEALSPDLRRVDPVLALTAEKYVQLLDALEEAIAELTLADIAPLSRQEVAALLAPGVGAEPGTSKITGWLLGLLDTLLPTRPVMQPVVAGAYAAASPSTDDKPTTSGEVTLLLLDHETATGRLAELSFSHRQRGGLWQDPEEHLRPLAWEALRTAFHAAARLMPGGLPPFPLEDHVLTLRVPWGPRRVIDGESLALPAALAFVSLWLDRPIASGVAATGRLRDDAEGISRVLPVAGAGEKAHALQAAWGGQPRVLAHPCHQEELERAGVAACPVTRLDEALARAGLDPTGALMRPYLATVNERVAALKQAVHDVEPQHLEGYRGITGSNPWVTMGDKIQLLVTSLTGEPGVDPADLEHAGVMAALAYLHGGDTEAAKAALGGLDVDEDTPAMVRVMARVVELEYQIDNKSWDRCAELDELLDRECTTLDRRTRAQVLGRALGTRGRAWMHQRQLDRALPLLQQAVEAHVEHQPQEAGRSRVYLSMALRMAGRHVDAASELRQAGQDLLEHTLSWDEPYYRNCAMYWSYECARLHVALAEPRAAEAHASRALQEASWRGWWPALGILRTRIWALRLLKRDEEADHDLARMAELLRQVDDLGRRLAEGIVVEARGEPRTDGEVY